MTNVKQKITCKKCGEPLPSESSTEADTGQPCENCGSTERTIKIDIHEEVSVDIHDQMKAKVKSNDPSFTGKKKIRKEIIAGDDYRVSKDDWVDKERVIDRDNGTYTERVTDKKTGEVIHESRESLKKHKGHGSDKKTP